MIGRGYKVELDAAYADTIGFVVVVVGVIVVAAVVELISVPR